MRIGLFGGTFDPPHAAHLGASLLAMKRLGLDRMWWLVTPGNPLKDTRHLRPLAERMAAARALAAHPRIDITGLEAVINTRYTYDTLAYLVRRCPGVRFVWVMGADNLRSFYRWQNWRGIASLDAHGGGRPHGLEPVRGKRPSGPGAVALSPARAICPGAGRAEPAGLALPARPEVAVVLNSAARLAKKHAEPLNPTTQQCLSYACCQ